MSANTNNNEHQPLFTRLNYIIFLAALALVTIGYLLMAGEGSTEERFQADIFSFRRIVAAPIFCFIGYALVIVGIIWKSHAHRN